MLILNIFYIGSWPPFMKLVVLGLESTYSSANSIAGPAKDGVWVRAFIVRTF